MVKPIIIDVDFKKNKITKEHKIRHGDNVPLMLRVFDDGEAFDLSTMKTITLVITRLDRQTIVLLGTVFENQATFNLGGKELAVSGSVQVTAQFYGANERVSTFNFKLIAESDPVTNYIPLKEEETLIVQVLKNGPIVIEAARTATNGALQAEESALGAADEADKARNTLTGAVDGALESLATDKEQALSEMSEERTLTEQVKNDTLLAKDEVLEAAQVINEKGDYAKIQGDHAKEEYERLAGTDVAVLDTKIDTVNETLKTQLADTAASQSRPPTYTIWDDLTDRGINVKWFGAIGDGVADDSLAVSSAIVFARTSKNNGLHFPPGTYKINQAAKLLINNSSFSITGGGYDSTKIIFTHANGGFLFDKKGGVTSGTYRIQLRDIRIDGNGMTTNLLEFIKHVEELIFHQTVLTNAVGALIKVDTVGLSWFSKCDFTYASEFITFNVMSNIWIDAINFWELGTVFKGNTRCYFVNIRDSWFEYCNRIFYGTHTFTSLNIKFDACTLIKNKGTSIPFEFESPIESNFFGFYNSKVTISQNIGTYINLLSPNTNESKVLRIQMDNTLVEAGAGYLTSIAKTTSDSLAHLLSLFMFNSTAPMFSTTDTMINGKGFVNSLRSEINTLTTGTSGIRLSDKNFYAGRVYYDNALKRLRVTNESDQGRIILMRATGTTASRPTDFNAGEVYYDDTLQKPIWWNGTGWNDKMSKFVSVPSSATALGNVGDWSADIAHLYMCHAINTWKRVAISAW